MSSPLESPEYETLYLGDTKDDDGQVIDSLFIETNTPAAPVIEAIAPAPLEEPKPTTRIFGGSFNFEQTRLADYTSPIQILPADANRKDLTIKSYSRAAAPTVTDFVFVADENGKMSANGTGKLRPSSSDFDLSNHTGAVWIYPGAITADFEINWWATTL